MVLFLGFMKILLLLTPISSLSLVNSRPNQLKLAIVPNFTRASIANWVQTTLSGQCVVCSDNLPGFSGLKAHAIVHSPINMSVLPDAKD